eukprot:1238592-Prorocentrum_lima.AAC.1
MNPNLNAQLPPEGSRVVDQIRRYTGHPCVAPTRFLESSKVDTRTRKLLCKELDTRGGERVGGKEGG